MSLEAFGVKNLRCLTDTGLVPIRRITVLVGKNSSGKSTFLRTFPLLQQSVRTKRNSPILWYGDGHPVDFGSLKEAASHWLAEPSVTFMFRVRLQGDRNVRGAPVDFNIEVKLAGGEIPHVREYVIDVRGQHARWTFDSQGNVEHLAINGETTFLGGKLCLGGSAWLFPNICPGESLPVSYYAAGHELSFREDPTGLDSDDILLPPLASLLKSTRNFNSKFISSLLQVGTPQDIQKQLSDLKLSITSGSGDEHSDNSKITALVLARESPYIVEAIDRFLSNLARKIAYLAPLRVSAQRAYRIANLSVEDIAPDGANLAMFLRSLSTAELESFATFTRQALGFETKVRTTGMHAEILVRQGTSSTFNNLIDVGFGFSEVLPLAAVVWNSCIRPTIEQRTPVSLVAIEQPELHLHPAHQAKLARMFATAALGSGDTKILLETHSESLINGFGKLIYEGVLKADDVQIVLFDQDEDTQRTTVRLAGYRESGALYDWPYGFLSPVAERRAPRAAAE